MSEPRRLRSSLPIARVGLDGQRLAAADESYNAVLATFVFCTIPDPALALAEVRRVLRPGGALHFLEHGLAPDPDVRAWQRRWEPLQRRLAGGCHLTRDLPARCTAAGLEVTELEQDYLAGPALLGPWTYCSRGRAVA